MFILKKIGILLFSFCFIGITLFFIIYYSDIEYSDNQESNSLTIRKQKPKSPLFYWSISSSVYPQLPDSIPAEDQRFIKKMCLYTPTSKIALDIYSLLYTPNLSPAEQDTLLSLKNSFYNQSILNSINNLKSNKYDISFKVIHELKNKLSECSVKPHYFKLFIPRFTWNSKNKFQTYFWGEEKDGFLKGNLGSSSVIGLPVSEILKKSILWTLSISLISVLLIYPLGIFLGVYSAIYMGSKMERFISFMGLILSTTPRFVIAILLLALFSNPDIFYWFPSTYNSANLKLSFWILPICSFSLVGIGFIAHQMKISMLKELQAPYLVFSISKGLDKNALIWKHAFKNALNPLISHIAVIIPVLFSGSLTIEVIFSVPGLGKAMYEAYIQRDYSVMYAICLLLTLLSLIGSFLMDLTYMKIYKRSV